MKKIFELSSLIHGQFKSESDFAKHIGWKKQRLNRIVLGDQKPLLNDIEQIANGLNVPFMLVANFFLNKKSTNR